MDPCVLTEQTFSHCCQLLLQQSQELKDGWSWETIRGSEEGYLRKTTVKTVITDSRQIWNHEGHRTSPCDEEGEQPCVSDSINTEMNEDVERDEDDGLCKLSEGNSLVLQYEYHIVYSCSYSTPVLYFRAFTLEGQSVSLEVVWSCVHPSFRLQLQRNPLNTISLQEHPLLGQPFFMLHPCKTEEFMRPVLQAALDQHRPVNYVLAWLSVVGPLVGLDVPLKFCSQPPHPVSVSSTEPD